jgi:hypothetical protein
MFPKRADIAMATTREKTTTDQRERLAELIRAHEADVARFRKEVADPAEALDGFLRDQFEPEVLLTLLTDADDVYPSRLNGR